MAEPRVFDTRNSASWFWSIAFFVGAIMMPIIASYGETADERRMMIIYSCFASPVLALVAVGMFLHMHNARVEVTPEHVISYDLFGKVKERILVPDIQGWSEKRRRYGKSWIVYKPVLHTSEGHRELPNIRDSVEFILLLREYNPNIPIKADYSHREATAPEPYDPEAGWKL